MKMAIIKFVYHALALDCLALVNSLRFELNVKRDSLCNAHLNDTVCMSSDVVTYGDQDVKTQWSEFLRILVEACGDTPWDSERMLLDVCV
jgi:hypothetical protein